MISPYLRETGWKQEEFFSHLMSFRFLKNTSIFKSLGIEFSQLNKYTYCIFEELELSSDIYQVDC